MTIGVAILRVASCSSCLLYALPRNSKVLPIPLMPCSIICFLDFTLPLLITKFRFERRVASWSVFIVSGTIVESSDGVVRTAYGLSVDSLGGGRFFAVS